MVVERELREPELAPPRTVVAGLGWLAVAGGASLGAGAIHATAIGVHADHRQAAIAFTVVAAVQLAWGAAALARAGRGLIVLGALANTAAIGGWLLAKTSGISFVDGLEEQEAVQLADGLAAALAAVAVLAAAAHLLGIGRRAMAESPLLSGGTAVLVAALALPGMLSADDHAHAVADDHDHEVAEEEVDAGPPAVVPPTPFHPDLPIDLGGVEGVTPEEQAQAENLLAVTLLRLPQFADPDRLEEQGFVSIGDGFLGHEHFLNFANMTDDRILDPDYPESVVYDTSVTPKRLVAAMFMLNPGDTLDDVPRVGGRLMQWHIHDNLCFAGARVAGLTGPDGSCPPGTEKGTETPMIHVWIEPHPCGPFAALEGIAGGSIPEGEERLCDHAHGA